jgi:hypothetical protein
MKHTSRMLAAVVAATALTFTGVHTADAKPAHAGSHAKAEKAAKAKGGKGAMTKLERDVARKVAQLGRTVSDQRLRRVDSEHATTVKENVAADQLALEALVAPAETTTTETAPATDVRATLKTYRPENYRLAVNILRQAAKAGETTEAETVAVDESVALALALTATSTKSDVKAARAAFLDAGELLEDEADEAEEETELETPEGDESADDTTGTEGGDAVTP